MAFFRRRKELKDRAERESRGESFWSRDLSHETRTRLAILCRWAQAQVSGDPIAVAWESLCFEEGTLSLTGSRRPEEDWFAYTFGDDPEKTAAGLEAFIAGLAESYGWEVRRQLISQIQAVLESDRVSWVVDQDGEIAELESFALHANVLKPSISLLRDAGQEWAPVETAFSDALGELADGKASDAVTDAGTALQQALQAAGYEGSTIGALMKSAKKAGFFTQHDEKLSQGLVNFFDWASANRSERGDNHNVVEISKADGWLMVHIVGAIIVWLHESSDSAG